jgi:uncharacterized membrane protein HdeD (DUF308 family)
MARSQGWEDELAGSLVGIAVIVVAVTAIIGVWLAVRAVNCILSAFTAEPRSRLLWGLLGATVILAALLLATQLALFGALALATLLGLLLVSRAVVLSHRAAFAEPQTAKGFLDDVVHDWWPEAA